MKKLERYEAECNNENDNWNYEVMCKSEDVAELEAKYAELEAKYTNLKMQFTALEMACSGLEQINNALEEEKYGMIQQNNWLEKEKNEMIQYDRDRRTHLYKMADKLGFWDALEKAQER